MRMLQDIFGSKNKKHCEICCCIMYPDSESTICECCLDELYESCPVEEEFY